VLLAVAGCYAFVPVSPSASHVGSTVQIALTDDGTLALTPSVGPSVGSIEGRLVSDSADTYVVSVSKTTRRDGAETDWRGEKVAIAHPLAAQVATRQISRTRTVAFSALTTGLLAALTEAFAGGSGGSVSGGGSGGTTRSGK
jgi:hypothetical protein